MSVKRPPRRYIGLRFRPASATRKEVQAAVEAAWRAAGEPPGPVPPPRLLVCEAGAAIVLVPRDAAPAARRALAATAARPGLEIVPVVTSGTITTVKARLGVSARKGPRGA